MRRQPSFERDRAGTDSPRVSAAIDSLPARCREILILRKLRGVPQKAIAAQLGLSEQTVQVQVSRGVRRCEEFLRAHGVQP
ncbi:MAG: RNA polymerase sigma factor [Opitutaceae bacterium]